MRGDYASWLRDQRYNDNTCSTQMAHVRQIEKYYGDLEALIESQGLESLVSEFTYTLADERAGRGNPTKVDFSGRNYTRLQSLKGAIKRYARFLDGGASLDAQAGDEPGEAPRIDEPSRDNQRFALERDMQRALREDIAALDRDLSVIDGGVERSVATGFIDITCEDADGHIVVVELKAGKTDARVVGQVLGYMGDLIEEDEAQNVRGIIVAHDFDGRTVSAARAIPNLKLMTYSFHFSFETIL